MPAKEGKTVIEVILDEMFGDCQVCHEGYIYQNIDEVIKCPQCNGKVKVLSWEGAKLQQAIMKGELN